MRAADRFHIGPKHVYAMLSVVIVLGVALAAAICVPYQIRSQKLDISTASWSSSDFSIVQRPSDINPGRDYVLYTNYACPYCAAFYKQHKTYEYTTRLLLRDNDNSAFDTQATVCSYMLALYREDSSAFPKMESVLFDDQGYWTSLNDEEVLAYLNARSGRNWSAGQLRPYLDELEADKAAIPDDLEFVPALYADGKCFNEYMLGLFE